MKREVPFFGYAVVVSVLWVPVAAWLMPRIASAPTWSENPSWYVSSGVLGFVLACVLRWVASCRKDG